jgi:hypothetical protein
VFLRDGEKEKEEKRPKPVDLRDRERKRRNRNLTSRRFKKAEVCCREPLVVLFVLVKTTLAGLSKVLGRLTEEADFTTSAN